VAEGHGHPLVSTKSLYPEVNVLTFISKLWAKQQAKNAQSVKLAPSFSSPDSWSKAGIRFGID